MNKEGFYFDLETAEEVKEHLNELQFAAMEDAKNTLNDAEVFLRQMTGKAPIKKGNFQKAPPSGKKMSGAEKRDEFMDEINSENFLEKDLSEKEEDSKKFHANDN